MNNARYDKGRKNLRNYYRILHVQADAPVQIIKSSYRTLLQKLKLHPDLGGEHGNAALINEAYAVLSDPARRAAYDKTLKQTHGRSTDAGRRPVERPDSPACEGAESAGKIHRKRHAYEQIVSGSCAFCHAPYTGHGVKEDAVCAACASPLSMAKALQREPASKRSISRLARELPVVFFTRWPQPLGNHGTVRDISPYGVCIHADAPLQYGQVIKIESDRLNAVARVVNCRHQPNAATAVYGIGVEFITLQLRHGNGVFFSDKA